MRICSFRTPNFLIGRDGQVPEAIVVHTTVGGVAAAVAWFGSAESGHKPGTSALKGQGIDGRR